MLVKELIEILKAMPQNAPVTMIIEGKEYDFENHDFELLKDGTVSLIL